MKCLIKYLLVTSSILLVNGCKKFVEVPPPVYGMVNASVFNSDATASAAVTGIFQNMSEAGSGIFSGGSTGLSALLGLSADEFTLYPCNDMWYNQAYTNSFNSTSPPPLWSRFYNFIYQANATIEGLSKSDNITPSIKDQLTGECKFIRALCHFYLCNLYGDVPLITTTDYKINSLISRSSKADVYAQMITDLKDAKGLLSDDYKTPDGRITGDRVRPNKGAATALLARVYLYTADYAKAEVEASIVISNNNLYDTVPLNNAFLANNKEAIWQLQLPNNEFNTADGGLFLLNFNGGPDPFSPFILSDSLVNNFEAGDLRKSNWVNSKTDGTFTYYFPYKYKLNNTPGLAPAEYPVLLRLSELYLIRAEARVQLGNISGSQSDINIIRTKAGLGNTTASDQSSLMTAVRNENLFEFFSENGHRWLELKRTNTVDQVMNISTPLKGGTWKSSYQLLPIPLSDIQKNPNLTQNPDY